MSKNELIVSLDPSSTKTGYCVIDLQARLIEAGVIAPENPSDPSYDRVLEMAADVEQVLTMTHPQYVLVEWTKGKVGQRHKGRGAGLAVYGAGVGGLFMAAHYWIKRHHPACQLIPILENDWTRGVKKDTRTLAVSQQYPNYHPDQDPGGDAADAIGLAGWWIKQRLAHHFRAN